MQRIVVGDNFNRIAGHDEWLRDEPQLSSARAGI